MIMICYARYFIFILNLQIAPLNLSSCKTCLDLQIYSSNQFPNYLEPADRLSVLVSECVTLEWGAWSAVQWCESTGVVVVVTLA